MDFEAIQDLVYEEYVKNGYEERWNHASELLLRASFGRIVDVAEVGLFSTEVSEAQEEIRHDNPKKEEEEIADMIIRAMNYCSRKGYHLQEAILAKHEINMKRDFLHGKKV